MKIVALADTHNRHKALDGFMPDADVLVHAGDLTMDGKLVEIEKVGQWLRGLPYKRKIVIAGNHDFGFEMKREQAQEAIGHGTDGIVYLQNEEYVYEGIKFYGMPQQPRFFDWAFNVDRGPHMRKYTNVIPADVDVLITHGPPMGILDHVHNGSAVGCADLFDRVTTACRPKAHIFGHIHCARGYKAYKGTDFYNAAIVNEKYQPVHLPFTLEV